MSEYIVDVGDADELHFAAFQKRSEFCFGYPVREEIVRCRACKYAEIDHSDHEYREPLWCGFHRMDVKPGGFCAWGE